MKRISIPNQGVLSLFGVHDANLKVIEKLLGVQLVSRGDELLVDGAPEHVQLLENVFSQLSALVDGGHRLASRDLQVALRLLRQDPNISLEDYFVRSVIHPSKNKRVMPRSLHQLSYLRAMQKFQTRQGRSSQLVRLDRRIG